MSPIKKQLRLFATEYFNARQTSLGISRSVRQRAKAVTTLILDTSSLTAGNLRFNRSTSIYAKSPRSDARLRQAAINALAGHDTRESRIIAHALDGSAIKIAPIAAPNDIVLGSIWHHGEGFEAFWIGSLPSITHYADLTENEREQLHILGRKLAAEGAVVYAISTSKSNIQPHRYRDVSATYLGLLIFHPVLFAGIEQTVADIRAHGIEIVYASQNPEHVVQSFARASCITSSHAIAFKYRRGHELALDKPLYAHLSSGARQQVIDHYGTQVLVVRGSLVEFWRKLNALRK